METAGSTFVQNIKVSYKTPSHYNKAEVSMNTSDLFLSSRRGLGAVSLAVMTWWKV
jgi:hypothetical protein